MKFAKTFNVCQQRRKIAPAKPKTIDVAGRVLTMSLLQEIDVTKQQRALAREEAKELRSTREKKRKRKPQPPTKSSIQAPESTPRQQSTKQLKSSSSR
ncbi:hypothetical protein Ae201684P_019258 [Aphanomyces euteiches]|nr:hypothetical protein Ae201684P_019258 [Aphanomyces euteiches]